VCDTRKIAQASKSVASVEEVFLRFAGLAYPGISASHHLQNVSSE
jgi:hypothetical protein